MKKCGLWLLGFDDFLVLNFLGLWLWMSDFHVLQTEVHLMMAFVGSRMRISGRISGGRQSITDSSSLGKSSVKDLLSSGKLKNY